MVFVGIEAISIDLITVCDGYRGLLFLADHSAKSGDGITVAKTLHRIEEKVVREEIEAAGFRLAAEADFLRNPDDPRDTRVFQPAIPVDEFVLKYRKPE